MGNCQAIDNATLAIQHPCGKVENLYWPISVSEVMKLNPDHYVALLLTTTTTTTATAAAAKSSVRITRIKLLRPTDTLVLGQVYRLFTTQEVVKGLWAKKYAKMKKKQLDSGFEITTTRRSELDKTNQVIKHERHRPRTTANCGAAKSKAWHPALHSISEGGS